MQGLMQWRMGMQLDAMHLFAELPPNERPREGLAGAHLPARGFYRVKTVSRDQLQATKATRRMTTTPAPSFLARLLSSRSGSSPEGPGRAEVMAPETTNAGTAKGVSNESDEAAEQDIRIAVSDV